MGDDPESRDRKAVLLPPELSAEETAARSDEARRTRGRRVRRDGTPVDGSERLSTPQRPSRLSRLSTWAGVGQRTTLVEIAGVTDTLMRSTRARIPLSGLRFQLTISAAAGALLLMLVSIALTVGNWRLIPVGALFTLVTVMLAYGAMRQMPRVARRFGELSLPGRAGMWVALFLSAVASVGAGVTWTMTRATVGLSHIVLPIIAPYVPLPAAVSARAKATPAPPKLVQRRWKGHLWVSPGLLFMPPSFHSEDGRFDLLLHFHGNPELVRDSVAASQLNALLHVSNLGNGSQPYQARFDAPSAFDALIGKIEEKTSQRLGTPGMKVRRIALMSWSAGYGGLLTLLNQPKVFERIDAVLVTDGIHGGFLPDRGREVDPGSIAPFVHYAQEAVAGHRLMVITHSAIRTTDFFSSTESADAIVQALGLERTPVAESPAEVAFPSAVTAFPARDRRWLQGRSVVHAGDFHLYGYAGTEKADHIAHLAQLSVTVLPALAERWREPSR